MTGKKLVRQYYLLVLLFTVIDFLFGSGYVAFMSYWRVADSSIGIILSTWSIVTLIFGIPFGIVADNFGRKKIMGIGFLIWGIGLLGFAQSRTAIQFTFSILMIAVGLSVIGQLPLSWFVSVSNEINEPELQDKSIPFAEAIAKIASFCTGVLFTILTFSLRGTTPYYVASIFAIFTGIVILKNLSMSPNETIKDRNSIRNIIENVVYIFRNKVIKLFIIKYLFSGIAGQLFVFCWQLYLVNDLGVSSDNLGVIFSFLTLSLALGYYFTSKIGKKYRKISISIFGNVIISIAFIMMFLNKSVSIFLFASLLFEFGLGVEQGANLIWIQPEIEENLRATTLSLISVSLGIASLFASWIIALFLSKLGFNTIWSFSTFLSLLGIALLLIITKIKKV